MDWFSNGYSQLITSLIAISGLAISFFSFWHMRKRDKKTS